MIASNSPQQNKEGWFSLGRKRRENVPNAYHHVYARGNNRKQIFYDETDISQAYRLLNMIHNETPIDLAAYCFMSNHYHFMIKSENETISKVMGAFNKRYTDYYNRRYDCIGHVFQQRFNSSPIDDTFGLLQVSRYIHQNPINTKYPMVKKMEDYPYSSYQFYKTGTVPPYDFINLHSIAELLPGANLQYYCEYAESPDRGFKLSW